MFFSHYYYNMMETSL